MWSVESMSLLCNRNVARVRAARSGSAFPGESALSSQTRPNIAHAPGAAGGSARYDGVSNCWNVVDGEVGAKSLGAKC